MPLAPIDPHTIRDAQMWTCVTVEDVITAFGSSYMSFGPENLAAFLHRNYTYGMASSLHNRISGCIFVRSG